MTVPPVLPNTRTRLLLAGAAVLVLLALLGWQYRRERLMSACLEQGGQWTGSGSSCRFPDGRILIRPDLRRI